MATAEAAPPQAPAAGAAPKVSDEDFNAFSESARSLEGDALAVVQDFKAEAAASAAACHVQKGDSPDATATSSSSSGNEEISEEVQKSREGLLGALSSSASSSKKADTATVPAAASTTLSAAALAEGSESKKPKRGRYATPKDFELLKVIGMGAFGKVLQCRNKASGEVLAMKVISKRLLRRKTSYVENIQAERDILTKCDHPFIVNMRCSFQTREKVFIVMDFLSGGELFLRLGREGIFMERTAAFYVAEITLALEHLHGRGILHRDLKPENILMSSDGHVCITDFGLAKDFSTEEGWNHEDGRARTVCGTQEYMAPEMVARKGYGKAADMWSLGCITYEMLAGRPPFESRKGSKELFKMIMNQRVKMPDGASAAACKLLKGLLNRDAQKRLGAAKSTMFEVGGIAGLKQLDFFKGLDWLKLEKKEIDPPERLDVEHDEDLKHFHDEFTKMTIPRSVKMMNQPNFQPRHVESDMFRGFSFVHDDFALPERQATEEEEYWANVDSDAYSMSECASSAFGDDIGENANAEPPQPAKKKRPPRKKKKKKKPVEEAASVASDAASKGTEGTAPAVDVPADTAVAAAPEPAAIQQPTEQERVDAAKKAATSPAKPLRPLRPAHPSPEEKAVMAAASPPALALPPPAKVQAPQSRPAKPKAPTWETVKKPAKTSRAAAPTGARTAQAQPQAKPVGASGWNRQQPVQRQPAPPPPPLVRPVAQSSPQPKPGSWAAKALSSKQQPPPALRANANTCQPARQNSGPPQSDWTRHSMPVSPRHARKTVAPPPPQADAFPTLGGMKKSTSAASTSSGGAWGKR